MTIGTIQQATIPATLMVTTAIIVPVGDRPTMDGLHRTGTTGIAERVGCTLDERRAGPDQACGIRHAFLVFHVEPVKQMRSQVSVGPHVHNPLRNANTILGL